MTVLCSWSDAQSRQIEMALDAYGLPFSGVVSKAGISPVFWIRNGNLRW